MRGLGQCCVRVFLGWEGGGTRRTVPDELVIDTELGSLHHAGARCRRTKELKCWFKDTEKGGEWRGGGVKPHSMDVLPLAPVSSLAFRLSVLGRVRGRRTLCRQFWSEASLLPWDASGTFFLGGWVGAERCSVHAYVEGGGRAGGRLFTVGCQTLAHPSSSSEGCPKNNHLRLSCGAGCGGMGWECTRGTCWAHGLKGIFAQR